MGNDGFVWMDDGAPQRGAPRRATPGPTSERAPQRREEPVTGERLVARIVDEAWGAPTPEEPTLRAIGEQLGLWWRAKVRRVRREAPRWAFDRIAARLLS